MDAGSEGRTDQETATLRELQALQQAFTQLTFDEQRLFAQQAQTTQQINEASQQAYQAQQANRPDYYNWAIDQRARALAAANNLQGQLGQVAARKQQIAARQQYLQGQLSALQSAQRQADFRLHDMLAQAPAPSAPAALPVPPPRRRGRVRWLWLAGVTVLVVVLASLGLALHLQPASTTTTVRPTPRPITLSSDNQPIYQAAGNLPSNQYCVSHLATSCLSPEEIQQAFRLNPLYRSGYDGKGQTIVLLDAGHTTTVQADLSHFDQTWGLPDPTLTIVTPHGPPAPYTCPGGIDYLEGETTLDVEWAHAIAPGAKIVVVLGSNHVGDNLQENCSGDLTIQEDVNYTITHRLGQVLSMSLGSSELGLDTDTPSDKANEQQYYQQGATLFQQAAAQHITVLAATGDDGVTNPNDINNPNSYWTRPNVSWPASDPNVLAVGGTTLSLDAANDYQSETVWNDPKIGSTGGGLSAVFSEPAYQKQVPNQNLFHGQRAIPDVAFPADGFLIYDSGNTSDTSSLGQVNPQWRDWDVVGGTSISAPCWAGLIAIANQVRGQPLGLIQPALYALQGKGMHDITTGSNSFHNVTGYLALKGFDLVSGWGTPIADQFIPDLVRTAEQQS
ncbi:MAG TPA: S53 family peptidase [Ktedonobacterales bacterium]|nr:S53 family peptidase [Ktedonobacterales bacterium]